MARPLLVIAIAVSLLPAACSPAGHGKVSLVVYSPHGKELLSDHEIRFEARYPGVDVKWLDMGSQDVLDRLRSEKNNPQADIWWGAPSDLFEQAGEEALLLPYRPTWAEAVPPEARGSGDFWYGTYKTPEVIAYNSALLKPDEAPGEWDDLLDPKWRRKIILRDPLASGTMRTIFCAMILREMEETGSPEGGYRWLRGLDANTKDYVPNLTILSQKLARREGWVTLWNMPDIELQRARYDYPLDYVLPAGGVPVVMDGIALVAKSEPRPAAREYYEFVTSRPSLVRAAREFFRIPARNDISPSELPSWIGQTPIPAMPLDRDLLRRHSREWMRYWDEHIRHKGDAGPAAGGPGAAPSGVIGR